MPPSSRLPARSAGRVRGYDADQIIDYTAAPIQQAVAGPPTAEPSSASHSPTSTTPGAGCGVRTVKVYVRSDAAQLARLVARVDADDLKIDVAERRPLTDLPAVHDQAVAGQLPGKTILIP